LGERDIGRLRTSERSRAGVARSWQSLELFEAVSVLENLQIASEASVRSLFASVRSLLWPGRMRLGTVNGAWSGSHGRWR
jgi:ABC-type branched-subunit amino acid transport system ATPase component